MSTIYDFMANRSDGTAVSMQAFAGKVLLVVNTASQCGFTPQYAGLEKLYQQYKDSGLVILAFPCNQFGKQEPGNAKTIEDFCQINYGVSFPIMEKIEVNGVNAHPFYRYLKTAKKGLLGSETIKWNFTKFLIDKKGKVIARYAPSTKPERLESAIKKLLD